MRASKGVLLAGISGLALQLAAPTAFAADMALKVKAHMAEVFEPVVQAEFGVLAECIGNAPCASALNTPALLLVVMLATFNSAVPEFG